MNKNIAETTLGKIQWKDDKTGYLECPGKSRHTTPDKEKDCRIKVDGVPTLYCVHSSCKEIIDKKNRELRAALNDNEIDSKQMSKYVQQRSDELELLSIRAANSLGRILRDYPWPLAQIEEDAPQIPEADETKTFLDAMYEPDDIIWIGDRHDSGQKRGEGHFQTLEGWESAAIAGPLICPNTFKLESVSRSNENIEKLKYLVVESDKLNKNQIGSIFRWLDKKAEQRLRAIVDTGNKSLHGWFEYPSDSEELEELKVVLPALGCDPKMFTPSQPARLPGVTRPETRQRQRLLYLATFNQGAGV